MANPFSLVGQYLNSSNYPTLVGADAAATAGNFILNIDRNWTLGSDTTLTCPRIIGSGGVIATNNHTLTLSGLPSETYWKIFDTSGGGSVVASQNSTGTEIFPEWWGANANTIQSYGSTCTISTTSLSVSGWAGFKLTDVGSVIWIPGAGTAGALYKGTITAFISSSQVTVSPAVNTSLSSVNTALIYGTDSTAAFNNMFTFAAKMLNGAKVTLSNGMYVSTGGHTFNISTSVNGNISSILIEGAGKRGTRIAHVGNNAFLTVTRSSTSNIYEQTILRDVEIVSSYGAAAYSSVGLDISDSAGYGIEGVTFSSYIYGLDVVIRNANFFTEGFYSRNCSHINSGCAYYITRNNNSPATSSYYGLDISGIHQSQGNSTTRSSSSPTSTLVCLLYMGPDGFAKNVYGAKIQGRINPGSGGNNCIFNVDGAGAASTDNILDGTFDIKSDGQGGNASSNNILFSIRDRTGSSLGKGHVYSPRIDFDPYQGQPGYLLDLSTGITPTSVPTWSNQIETGSNNLAIDTYGNPLAVTLGVKLSVYGTIGAHLGPYNWLSGQLAQNSSYLLTISTNASGAANCATYMILTRASGTTCNPVNIAGTLSSIFTITSVASQPNLQLAINNSAIASVSTFRFTLERVA